MLRRTAGGTGAECILSGDISIYAKWTEDIYFRDPESGDGEDISGLSFYLQFRVDPSQTSADVTLSTVDGTLSIQEDSGSVDSILRISAAAGTFSNYEGDMIADLVAVDQNDNETHYAHGIVTFHNDPVAA